MKRTLFCAVAICFAFASRTMAQEVVQSNVQPINNSLTLVSKLQPVSFNYDKSWAEKLGLKSSAQFGFVGADAQKTNPALVQVQAKDYPSGKNAFKTATITKVDYENLIPLLVGSIQEQQVQIEALKQEIQALKAHKAE